MQCRRRRRGGRGGGQTPGLCAEGQRSHSHGPFGPGQAAQAISSGALVRTPGGTLTPHSWQAPALAPGTAANRMETSQTCHQRLPAQT